MPRTVTIHSDFTTIAEQAQKLIDRGATHPGPEIERAIGYLSTWSLSTYPTVDIFVDSDGDMTAPYARPDGAGYMIAAVWNGSRFGFHS